jgi:hypothetical protein
MMGTKKLSEIRAEVTALVNQLPNGWLAKEIKAAKGDSTRRVKTLEMLAAALDGEVKKRRKSKARRPSKR